MAQVADDLDGPLSKRQRLSSPSLSGNEASGFGFNNDWREQFENDLPDELLQPSSSGGAQNGPSTSYASSSLHENSTVSSNSYSGGVETYTTCTSNTVSAVHHTPMGRPGFNSGGSGTGNSVLEDLLLSKTGPSISAAPTLSQNPPNVRVSTQMVQQRAVQHHQQLVGSPQISRSNSMDPMPSPFPPNSNVNMNSPYSYSGGGLSNSPAVSGTPVPVGAPMRMQGPASANQMTRGPNPQMVNGPVRHALVNPQHTLQSQRPTAQGVGMSNGPHSMPMGSQAFVGQQGPMHNMVPPGGMHRLPGQGPHPIGSQAPHYFMEQQPSIPPNSQRFMSAGPSINGIVPDQYITSPPGYGHNQQQLIRLPSNQQNQNMAFGMNNSMPMAPGQTGDGGGGLNYPAGQMSGNIPPHMNPNTGGGMPGMNNAAPPFLQQNVQSGGPLANQHNNMGPMCGNPQSIQVAPGLNQSHPAGAQDPEKRKLIQQQLILLLHAHKCQQRDREAPNGQRPCILPHCSTMKNVLSHMTSCKEGRDCQHPHCSSSRQIIAHWKNCKRTDCPVCLPLKQVTQNAGSNADNILSQFYNPQSGPGSFISPTELTASDLLSGGVSVPLPASSNPASQQCGSNQLSGRSSNIQQQQPPVGAVMNPRSVQNVSQDQIPFSPQNPMLVGAPIQCNTNISSGSASGFNSPRSNSSTGGNVNLPTSNQVPGGGRLNQNQSVMNGSGGSASIASGPYPFHNSPSHSQLLQSLTNMSSQVLPNGLPPPEGASVQKEWHKQVTQDLRNHLVSKLVKAIFPSPDPAAIHDQRIKDLIAYARKVEKEMFEQANDREEYYHLLAEKIYKIQKELQEKKQKRLQQQHAEDNMRKDDGPPPNRTVPMDPYNCPPLSVPRSNAQPFQPQSRGPPGLNAGSSSSMPLLSQVKPEDVLANGFLNDEDKICDVEMKGSMSADRTFPNTLGDPTAVSMEKDTLKDIKQEPQVPVDANNTSNNAASAVTKVEATSTTEAKPVVQKAPRKVFAPDDLRNALLPIHEKIERMDESVPFRVPVDPDLLHIPDYFDIIKNPMDLSTIRTKLDNGEYQDPWEFCDDMWLMCENAWLYNRKNSKVYKYCTKLSEVFMDSIDPVMQSLGYCCGHKLHFTPLALFCYGQPMCTIPRDTHYYCYQTNSSQYGVTVSEKYTYCKKCFEELAGDSINLSDDPSSTANLIQKSQFSLLKNDQIEYEPFVDCVECGRKWHQICALHLDQIWPGGFVCENCLKATGRKRPENRFSSKRLPSCKLASYIEQRVNTFLKKKDAQIGEVVIRLLSSSDKEVEVKPLMRQREPLRLRFSKTVIRNSRGLTDTNKRRKLQKHLLQNNTHRFVECGELPEKFPYRAKAIFAFQNIDGAEVCIFGMHVQEYGSDALQPNTRRVYLAYLDSVFFFQPKQYRTAVYHEILLGYLDYAKQQGYTMAHIWACPPSEGDDYIFHCHPPDQKIPKPKRLQEWYKKMLDKGIIERIVVDYKDIHRYAMDENMTSAAQLYYFEGDFWPNVMEEAIRELDAEEEKMRKEEQAQNVSEAFDDDDEVEDGPDGAKGIKKNKTKGSVKKNKSSKNKLSGTKKNKKGIGSGNEMTDKLYATMEKHKEVFFAIPLHSKQTAATLGPVVDPDSLYTCELMDGRDNFLSMARERHWEFSSLRRSKFTTMAMCYELHTQGQDKFVYTCNNCKNNNARWHCTVCDDYDLCTACHERLKHEHKMEPLNSLISEDTNAPGAAKTQDQNSRNESIQRCIQSLVHACQCRDANCRRMSCHKMKRVVQHTKMCKRRQAGNCPVCKQLIALCCYHAKNCTEQQCLVPFCQNIRQKLAEQQQQMRLKKEREMRRRMMVMHGMPQANTAGGPGSVAGAGPATPGSYGPPSSGVMSQPASMPHSSPLQQAIGHPGQNVCGSLPQQSVPQGAVEVAKQIERIAARAGSMNASAGAAMPNPGALSPGYGRQIPGGMPPNNAMSMPQPGGPRMPQMNSNVSWDMQNQQQGPSFVGGGAPMNGPAGGGQFAQNPQLIRMPPQGAMQMHPQQRMASVNHGGNVTQQQMATCNQLPAGVAAPVGSQFPPGVNQNRLMQNFIVKLKTARSQDEQRQVINELRQNPQLFQQFLRMREASASQQAQNHVVNNPGGAPMPPQHAQVWNGQRQIMPNMQQQQQQPQVYGGLQHQNVSVSMNQQVRPMNSQGFVQQQHPQQMVAAQGYNSQPQQQQYVGYQGHPGPGAGGQMLPPVSPLNASAHMGMAMHSGASQNVLSQVRSPPSGPIVRSPGPLSASSPRPVPSPHHGVSHMQQQCNPQAPSLPQLMMDNRPHSQGPPPDPGDPSKFI